MIWVAALALVLPRSGTARVAAPAIAAPLRNVRRPVRFDQTVPSTGSSVPGTGFMTAPGDGGTPPIMNGAGGWHQPVCTVCAHVEPKLHFLRHTGGTLSVFSPTGAGLKELM